MDEDNKPITGIGKIVKPDELIVVDEADTENTQLAVLVNSGFGHGSYPCKINSDSTMSLPEGLVKELKLTADDDLGWTFNEDDGTLYVRVIHKDWEAPEWLRE